MAADIVNLRRARKLKARVEKEANAARNRKLFGTSVAERRLRDATRNLEDKQLEGLRRTLPDADGQAGKTET